MKEKSKVTGEGSSTELQLTDAHPNHDKHLCSIVTFRNMKMAARLSKDARYLCFICGRAAKRKQNLCWPVEM